MTYYNTVQNYKKYRQSSLFKLLKLFAALMRIPFFRKEFLLLTFKNGFRGVRVVSLQSKYGLRHSTDG